MIVKHLNDDTGSLSLPDKTEFVVTDYEIGSYEGDGHALAITDKCDMFYANLSHCSCYGPDDADFKSTNYNIFTFADDDILCAIPSNLIEAAKQYYTVPAYEI
jgi:hypothetical protein